MGAFILGLVDDRFDLSPRLQLLCQFAISLIALATLLWLVFERAWIGEDAFITFRSVDQFVNGNGLRWNPDERVQAYTHPLWMLALIPFYSATRSLISAVVTLGLVCTAGTYLLLAARLHRRPFVLPGVDGGFADLTAAPPTTQGCEAPPTLPPHSPIARPRLVTAKPEGRSRERPTIAP